MRKYFIEVEKYPGRIMDEDILSHPVMQKLGPFSDIKTAKSLAMFQRDRVRSSFNRNDIIGFEVNVRREYKPKNAPCKVSLCLATYPI